MELDLGQLQAIMEDKTRDIRVVHLVRDPRAIMASRRQVFTSYENAKPYSVIKQCNYLCAHMKENIQQGDCFNNSSEDCSQFSTRGKWKGKYLRLRFEDVSLNPLVVAQEIYDFLGIDFDPEVRKWIEENTKQKAGHTDLFGTGRNSLAAVGRWKNLLTFDEVTVIQKRCEFVMRKLNYKNISNATQLKNENSNLWW